MLPTKEQKRVSMMQEKAIKDIVYQFSDQREKMGTLIQKRLEKLFKGLHEDTNSYMLLLISSNCTNHQVEQSR